MKEQIREMLKAGATYDEIVKAVGCTKPTISYHATRLGLRRRPDAKGRKYDWSAIAAYYHSGKTMTECRKAFGWFSNGAWDNAVRMGIITPREPSLIPLEELLVAGRTQTGRGHLKRRLLDAGLLQNRCYGDDCTLTDTWLGRPLALHLEHKNGNRYDNRLENLCLLCPNCHSQTPTYAGRNSRKP